MTPEFSDQSPEWGAVEPSDGGHRLPLRLDDFVARDEEMAGVMSLLGECHMVTVTGPGGVGKSRLALEVATALASGYRDGVVFVALAGVTDPAVVAQVVASVLALAEQPGRALTETLADHLRRRQMLMVIDNCEHLAHAVAGLVEGLLPACGDLTILATSQERLGLAAERAWALEPLELPSAVLSTSEAQAAPAVRLFCQRAAAVRPGFLLTDDIAPAVVDICRTLDGLPLALELAAAWVTVLSPTDIAARLGDRFGLLTRGSRSAPARHQSLQAALDWSYRLCSEREQALLRRFSVFAGSASLDAAAEVCSGGELAHGEVLDAMTALVSRSLVVAAPAGRETRYRLLETVSHYAGARLRDANETEHVRARHGDWYAGLAESAEAGITGSDQAVWLARLEADHDNLRAALDRTIATGQAVAASRMAGALTLFWRIRGYLTEGRDYLDAALALGDTCPTALRARALWGSGFLTAMLGDTPTAVFRLEKALSLFRELDDLSGWARSLLVLANCHIFNAPLEAQPMLEQSTAMARDASDEWCLAHALALGGLSHLNQGEPAAAGPLLEEAVTVARHGGDSQGLRIGLILLGNLALRQGDHNTAEAAFSESLTITEDLGEAYGTAAARVGLGQVWLARGDQERARRFLDRGSAEARAAANPDVIAIALCLQARLAWTEGDLMTAEGLYSEALEVAAEAGCRSSPALRGLGEVASAQDDPDRAARLFQEALDLVQEPRDDSQMAAILYAMANAARREGRYDDSVSLHHQALVLRRGFGDTLGFIDSLEALGGLAACSGRRWAEYAARLLGAADALRETHGYARLPAQRRLHESDVTALRQCVDAERFEAARIEGSAMSVQQVCSYVNKVRGARGRSDTGWASLTKTERAVVALAVTGLSNPEIAKRLFIAPSTVKSHMKRVFSKVGINSRVDLAREWPG